MECGDGWWKGYSSARQGLEESGVGDLDLRFLVRQRLSDGVERLAG